MTKHKLKNKIKQEQKSFVIYKNTAYGIKHTKSNCENIPTLNFLFSKSTREEQV